MRCRVLAAVLVGLGCACLATPPGPGPGGGPADAGAVDASSWEAECDTRFDAELEYLLCLADGTSCRFFSQRLATCDEICERHGTVCVSSFNTSGGSATCEPSSADEGCDDTHDGQICVCTR